MIALIFASDYDTGVIGNKGDLPWGRLPNDLQFFKETTMGHNIVMGRKTWDSLGRKPLKGRTNIILSSTLDPMEDCPEGGLIINDFDELLDYIGFNESFGQTFFIIGGAYLFDLFIQYADVVYHTVVHGQFEGDTFFPGPIGEKSEWKGELLKQTKPDEKNPYYMDFFKYTRIPEDESN
jgi:dihydrofolate reductase